MEHLPIPHLYRVTNNEFSPNINSVWINESGDVIRVTKIQSKKRLTIVFFKNEDLNDKYSDDEFSVSLYKFHSTFSPFNY